jgi:hypothetical protein
VSDFVALTKPNPMSAVFLSLQMQNINELTVYITEMNYFRTNYAS